MNTTDSEVTLDARSLSSGSLSYLIDNTNYDVISEVQSRFVQFCRDHEGEFETWVKAWHAFIDDPKVLDAVADRWGATVNLHPQAYNTVQGEGAPQYTFLPAPAQQFSFKL